MTGLEEGAEVTSPDFHRMALIDIELRQFVDDYKRKHKL